MALCCTDFQTNDADDVVAEAEYDHLLSPGEAVDFVILIVFRMAVPPLGPQGFFHWINHMFQLRRPLNYMIFGTLHPN
jgi:hypothetical protein